MRKFTEYMIEDGEDKGKVFIITRMPLLRGDKWAHHFIKALAEAGEKISPKEVNSEIEIFAELRPDLTAHLKEEDLDKVYNDLFKYCQIKRDPRNPLVEPTKILDVDINDPLTLSKLRQKAFALHLDFLIAAASQIFSLISVLSKSKSTSASR